MEIRELRYFVALAEELHFGRAAARVGIEQSPLSKAISELERHLSVRLFIRTRRSTTLTCAGEMLLQDARRILVEVEQARRNIAAAASGHRGRLRIAVCDGLAHPRIAALLAESRSDSPDVDIQIVHNPFPDQLRGLRAGVIDVAFALSSCSDRDLSCVPLWKDAVVVVTRPNNQLSQQQSVQQIELDTGPLILLGQGSANGFEAADSGFLSAMQGHGRIEYVASAELLLTMVAAGYGIGIMSAAQAETIRRPDLVARPLNARGAQITTFLLVRSAERSMLIARFTERALKMTPMSNSAFAPISSAEAKRAQAPGVDDL